MTSLHVSGCSKLSQEFMFKIVSDPLRCISTTLCSLSGHVAYGMNDDCPYHELKGAVGVEDVEGMPGSGLVRSEVVFQELGWLW